jgi:outer membrane protein OmpA-like peptidoglycan-associated protein
MAASSVDRSSAQKLLREESMAFGAAVQRVDRESRPVKGATAVRSLTGVIVAALALVVGPGAAQAQGFDPDAPVPPGAKFVTGELKFPVLDLTFRTEPVAGVVQALEVKETPTEIRIELAADVLFDFDKADIRPDASKVLSQAADVLKEHSTRRVVIEGHTDGKGTEEYNQRLSQRRAQAVKRWFEERAGLKSMALETRGWGAKRPVAPNAKPDGTDDPAGRQKNRRVEIVIAKQSQR